MRRPLLAILVLTATGGAGPARAADIDVNPVNVALAGNAPSALLTIRNTGAEKARFEITAFAWAQRDDGQMELAPSDEIIVFPPLLELAAGEERRIRVGTSAKVGPAERSWRIFLEELPSSARPAPGELRMLTRVGIPVFLEPAHRLTRAELRDVSLAGRTLSFRLANTGTVHFRPAVQVAGVGAAGERLFASKLDAWYVLAGGDRVLRVDAPADACAKVRQLQIDVQVDRTALHQIVPAPSGACGP